MQATLEGAMAIYVALAVVLSVLGCIAAYLWVLGRQARALRREIEQHAQPLSDDAVSGSDR
ncbi:MAG: hypothetical protein MUD01_10110 [Chloroflexaceae bacterium]|nr:hypothetical protein [Chloroflexaceae bacterium]